MTALEVHRFSNKSQSLTKKKSNIALSKFIPMFSEDDLLQLKEGTNLRLRGGGLKCEEHCGSRQMSIGSSGLQCQPMLICTPPQFPAPGCSTVIYNMPPCSNNANSHQTSLNKPAQISRDRPCYCDDSNVPSVPWNPNLYEPLSSSAYTPTPQPTPSCSSPNCPTNINTTMYKFFPNPRIPNEEGWPDDTSMIEDPDVIYLPPTKTVPRDFNLASLNIGEGNTFTIPEPSYPSSNSVSEITENYSLSQSGMPIVHPNNTSTTQSPEFNSQTSQASNSYRSSSARMPQSFQNLRPGINTRTSDASPAAPPTTRPAGPRSFNLATLNIGSGNTFSLPNTSPYFNLPDRKPPQGGGRMPMMRPPGASRYPSADPSARKRNVNQETMNSTNSSDAAMEYAKNIFPYYDEIPPSGTESNYLRTISQSSDPSALADRSLLSQYANSYNGTPGGAVGGSVGGSLGGYLGGLGGSLGGALGGAVGGALGVIPTSSSVDPRPGRNISPYFDIDDWPISDINKPDNSAYIGGGLHVNTGSRSLNIASVNNKPDTFHNLENNPNQNMSSLEGILHIEGGVIVKNIENAETRDRNLLDQLKEFQKSRRSEVKNTFVSLLSKDSTILSNSSRPNK